MKTQTKYEVSFRDGFANSSEWFVAQFETDDDAAEYLLKVQQDGHIDIRLGFWEKEDGDWNCTDMYNEEECVQTGFLPEPKALAKQRGEIK
jgi:hypothetical protein